MSISVTPAYGRDYTRAEDVKADWQAEKDFLLNDPTSRWDGKPINRQHLVGQVVVVRYGNGKKTVQVQP